MMVFSLNFCGTNINASHITTTKCGSIPKLIHPWTLSFVQMNGILIYFINIASKNIQFVYTFLAF